MDVFLTVSSLTILVLDYDLKTTRHNGKWWVGLHYLHQEALIALHNVIIEYDALKTEAAQGAIGCGDRYCDVDIVTVEIFRGCSRMSNNAGYAKGQVV